MTIRIPYERSYELARQYGVDELLRPLFEFVPGPDDDMETPRKKRPRASSRLSNSSLPVTNSHMMNNDAGKHHPYIISDLMQIFLPIHCLMNNLVSTRKRGFSDANHPGMVPQPIHNNENYPPFYHQLHPHHQPFPSHLQSAQVRPMSANSERYRAMLMSIFLNHENHKLPDLITSPHTPPDLDIDLIIDDQGHTSLHWAAALSRINVLQLLLNHGADPRRVNFNGESALIRAALVTNNFDNDSFYDLLILLHPAIDIVDKKGRSIVHHIALTAGIKGRVQASRYYLDTMLDMMQKNGIDIRSIIDLQDKNGDTALNIAARIGNRSLVEQMLKSGANAEIPNRAGLRPLDFGLEDVKLASLFQSKVFILLIFLDLLYIFYSTNSMLSCYLLLCLPSLG
jgi:ankyrin repeat protein